MHIMMIMRLVKKNCACVEEGAEPLDARAAGRALNKGMERVGGQG